MKIDWDEEFKMMDEHFIACGSPTNRERLKAIIAEHDQLLADKRRLEVGLETAKQIRATLMSDIDELIDQRDNGGGIWGKLTARALDERDQLRRELDEAREYLRAPVGMEMMKRIAALEAELKRRCTCKCNHCALAGGR